MEAPNDYAMEIEGEVPLQIEEDEKKKIKKIGEEEVQPEMKQL